MIVDVVLVILEVVIVVLEGGVSDVESHERHSSGVSGSSCDGGDGDGGGCDSNNTGSGSGDGGAD